MTLEEKYLKFSKWLFNELLKSRSNYLIAIKNNWSPELKNVLKSHNEIIEEVWEKLNEENYNE